MTHPEQTSIASTVLPFASQGNTPSEKTSVELHSAGLLEPELPKAESESNQPQGDASSREADVAALSTELALLRSQERDRTTRIHDLEQALDQALAYLEEMRVKVEEQGLLESQLAATEKFACVQQQAIARLRLRIKQQQQIIDTHLDDVRSRSRAIINQPFHSDGKLEALAAPETPETLNLEAQIGTLQTALTNNQQRIAELEQEANRAQELASRLQGLLETAQQQVQNLSVALSQHEARVAELEAQIATSDAEPLALKQPLTNSRGQTLAKHNQAIATLGRDLAKAQIKVEELEIELARQLRLQAMWQHSYRELQAECDRYSHRVMELDQQTHDMQEQIFQQAQQSTEYEAAIQHWKDQYLTSQHQIAHLRELLEETQLQILANERVNPALSAIFSELLAVVEFASVADVEELHPLFASAVPRLTIHDIPEFLLRRRNYRPQA